MGPGQEGMARSQAEVDAGGDRAGLCDAVGMP